MISTPDCWARKRRSAARAPCTCPRSGRLLQVFYSVAPPLYRRLAHRAFVQGTWGSVPAGRGSGNVLRSTGPHAVEGGWRTRRRPLLRRAFSGAAAGAIASLFKRRG